MLLFCAQVGVVSDYDLLALDSISGTSYIWLSLVELPVLAIGVITRCEILIVAYVRLFSNLFGGFGGRRQDVQSLRDVIELGMHD